MAVNIRLRCQPSSQFRKMAIELENPSARHGRRRWQRAKLLGLIIDRREVGDVGAFDHLTDEELMREAEKKARELGLCVQPLNKAH